MSSSNSNKHFTIAERIIIEQGIRNGATKSSIANTLGKDKSTVGKEIKLRRTLAHSCRLPLECAAYKKCKYGRDCIPECPGFIPFRCSRRDRSPGACNGCENYSGCRFNKYKYSASEADHEYKMTLHQSREGINITTGKLKEIGNIMKPLIDNGQSVYAILSSHPEITLSEHTIYNYIDRGAFQDVGISIKNIDLPRKAGRKITKTDSVKYKTRKDYSYLKGRTKKEYDEYTATNPNAHIVQMDTVYNDVSNGPFMQTFKFLRYDLLIVIYHDHKESEDMLAGILLLEKILGRDLFEKEVEVLVTDRGSEFVLAGEAESRDDGTTRTRVFYCDPMCSWQKGSLENIHELIRRICPHNCDLRALGLTDQNKANLISSHVNSYPKEKLDGKTSFQLVRFYNPVFFEKLKGFGITEISPDDVLLKPFLLKE